MFDINDYKDSTIYDSQGEKIGSVDDLFIDEETGEPEWLLVDTGFLGPHAVVPVQPLTRSEDGFTAPYTSDQVKGAPGIDKDADTITKGQERKLYDYYGVAYGEGRSGTLLPESGGGSQQGGEALGAPLSERESSAQGTSGLGGSQPETAGLGSSQPETSSLEEPGREGSSWTGGAGAGPSGLVRMSRQTSITRDVGGSAPVRSEEVIVDRETVTGGSFGSEGPLGETSTGMEPAGDRTEEELRRERFEEQLRDEETGDEGDPGLGERHVA